MITPETYPRMERAREQLGTPRQPAPTWYRLAKDFRFTKQTMTKIKAVWKGTGKKNTVDLSTADKLSRALKMPIGELFQLPTRYTETAGEMASHHDEAALTALIDEASIPGRHVFSDGEAVKELAHLVTIHPAGHAGAVDLVRALLDVASIIRLAGEGPVTPEKMMRQIARQVAMTHPLEGARTPEQAIGQLVKSGKGKSGPISRPKIPISPVGKPEK